MWSHRLVVHSEDYAKPTTLLKERLHNVHYWELHALFFTNGVLVLLRPTEFKGCETGPTVYSLYPRRLERQHFLFSYFKTLSVGPAGVGPLTMQIEKKQARTTSKPTIAKYTHVFSTSNHRFMAKEDNIFFSIVPALVDSAQYYWPLLHVSRFL